MATRMISGSSLQAFLLLILLLVCMGSAFHNISGAESGEVQVRCKERERRALLMIKQELIDGYGHLSSWGNEEEKRDCCKWRGVSCSNRTDHVVELNLEAVSTLEPFEGNISSSLVELRHLSFLNLRNNYLRGNQIPEFIGSLRKLKHLDLSGTGFHGRLPYQLGNLSRLQYLNLSYNPRMYADKLAWMSNLSSLRYVYLHRVNLSEATDWIQVFSGLPSLTELHLKSCELPSVNPLSVSYVNSSKSLARVNLCRNYLSNFIYLWLSKFSSSLVDLSLCDNMLQGPIPEYAFSNMTSLLHLDLSGNKIDGLSRFSSSLVNLDISFNKIQGPIPDHTFWNMTSLLHLYINGNEIDGIPNSIGKLCRLKTLRLLRNNLSAPISEVFLNLSGCTRDTLESLLLGENMLSGSIPEYIAQFSSLEELYLSANNLSGSLPRSLGQLSHLTTLYLDGNKLEGLLPDFNNTLSLQMLSIRDNRLNGTLTKSIGKLHKLEELDLSSNFLEDIITEVHMSNLSSLQYMDLSFNSLTLNFSSGWVPSFQLDTIRLAAVKLGPDFPKWLQTQKRFVILDMSDAGILGAIPDWFWDQSPTLNSLNLSHNHLTGMLPDISTKFAGRPGIDLSSNNFEGPIPPVPFNLTSLLLSNNQFSGSISTICQTSSVIFRYLDLSKNRLSGGFPDCWVTWQEMKILHLANNNFSGKLPNPTDSKCDILSLHLRNNSFTGEVPSSLKHCAELTILDLGNNELSGTIPAWLGANLPDLTVINLRSNRFHGNLPSQLCHLAKVQVLDFSQNDIVGSIPECLGNLTLMSQKESSNAMITYVFPIAVNEGVGNLADFQDHTVLVWKRVESEYQNNLGLLKGIDFSSNKLSGAIPEDITNLAGLVTLNLSRNSLTGHIPQKVYHLDSLNALDLSKNRLTGEIPENLSQLHALGILDLSNNNLSGRIPSNSRLQGYDAPAYMGNPGLCGPPLHNECPREVPAQEPVPGEDSEDGFLTLGLYISASLGFITGFWGVCGTLVLNNAWRYAYFGFLEYVKDKLYLLAITNIAHLWRRLHQ